MFKTAITRIPCEACRQGLTTACLGLPDYRKTLQQHLAYIAALRQIGLSVEVLEPEPNFPDAHFVEDTAVIFPELAVISRPGVLARRGEIALIEPVLARQKSIQWIRSPGTLDGGDVLTIDKQVYVGLTDRTNRTGFDQLQAILEPFGYICQAITVAAGLHLKSSVNYVGDNTILLTADFADCPEWNHFNRIIIDPGEEYAANTLWVNDHLLTPMGFPNTLNRIRTLGLPILELEMSELQKMDGGLTCLSLRS